MKLSLGNPDAIKGFVLNHGEKVGIAFVGLFVLLLVYQTLGIDRIEKENEPDNLLRKAESAIEYVHRTKFDPEAFVQPVYTTMKPIHQDRWKTSTDLDPRIWPPNTKRDDPELYGVEKIEVSADFGPIAMRDPSARNELPEEDAVKRLREENEEAELAPGRRGIGRGAFGRRGHQVTSNDRLEGKAWVVVVGRISLKKQINEFDRVFQDAEFRSNNDVPNYRGYQIQRRDVTENGDAKWGKPKAIITKTLEKETLSYSGRVREIADSRYVDPQVLTWPLPSLVGRDFGRSVVHSDIPLAPTPEQLMRQRMERSKENQSDDDPTEAGDDDVFDDDQAGGGGRLGGGRMGGPGGGFGGRGLPGGMGGGMDGMMGGGMPGGPGRGMGGRAMGPMAGMGMGRSRQDGTFAQVPYLLFRFFDFDARPGRRYEYRVRLVMRDPNHLVPPRYLTKVAADRRADWRKSYRYTPWSESSPPIAVPFAGRMLAGRAKAPSRQRFEDEPKVSVLVKTFDAPQAAEAITELVDVARGTVGNLTRSIDILKLVDNRLKPIENYPFHTESTILDIRGGRKLSRNSNEDLTAPAQMLILTRTGKLIVQSELKDQEEYEEYRTTFENKKDEQDQRNRGMPPGGPGGGPGGIFNRGGGRPR